MSSNSRTGIIMYRAKEISPRFNHRNEVRKEPCAL